MRTLKDRLNTVLTLVPKGSRVADIGTDHGHLPISLVKTGISPYVYACDIKEKPLSVARANIEKCSLKNIETRLSDGLDKVLPHEVDCIVIAGMGGEVIEGIITACSWIKNSRYTLILQPMTAADSLRRFLCANGFETVEEKAVLDSGRLYCVIKTVYTGNVAEKSEAFYRVGRLDPKFPTDKAYIEKQLNIALKCKLDLENSGRDFNFFEKLCLELKTILGEK